MALGDVTFIKGQGGLGRSLPGKDHYSAMLFYSNTLPSGFSSGARIVKMLSISDAENAGINLDYSDETPATATYTVTTSGTNGDTLELKVQEWKNLVSLGVYTKTSAESTTTLSAAAIAAVINAGTLTHGYSAVAAIAVVTITARKGTGAFLNAATALTKVIVGATLAGTIADFSGGVASFRNVMWYHINQSFLKNPKLVLWVGIYSEPGTLNFAEVKTIKDFALGEVRQMGVFVKHVAFATSQCDSLKTIQATCEAEHAPLSILYNPDIKGTALSALPDLSTLSDNKVSVLIGQDGNGLGNDLYNALAHSVGCMGAALGSASLALVSESIAWIGKFNEVDADLENDVAAFSNGVLFTAQTTALINATDDLRYIFFIKKPGKTGTFFNNANTAIAEDSDYAYLEDNRTIDKAVRGIYVNLLDDLNSPIDINADGTIAASEIAYLESKAGDPLAQMVRDGEISDFGVTIDPDQNVVGTGKIVIAVQIINKGVARNILIPISFTNSIS